VSTVLVPPTPANSGPNLTLQLGGGGRMPAPPFDATVWPQGQIATIDNAEVVRVTLVSGDTLVMTRAIGNSNTRTILIGDVVMAGVTVSQLVTIEQAILDLYTRVEALEGE
jgi:hypothetical protein